MRFKTLYRLDRFEKTGGYETGRLLESWAVVALGDVIQVRRGRKVVAELALELSPEGLLELIRHWSELVEIRCDVATQITVPSKGLRDLLPLALRPESPWDWNRHDGWADTRVLVNGEDWLVLESLRSDWGGEPSICIPCKWNFWSELYEVWVCFRYIDEGNPDDGECSGSPWYVDTLGLVTPAVVCSVSEFDWTPWSVDIKRLEDPAAHVAEWLLHPLADWEPANYRGMGPGCPWIRLFLNAGTGGETLLGARELVGNSKVPENAGFDVDVLLDDDVYWRAVDLLRRSDDPHCAYEIARTDFTGTPLGSVGGRKADSRGRSRRRSSA